MSTTNTIKAEFTAWELETIFHMASNSAAGSSSPFFEKYQALASKAINQRSEKFPDYVKKAQWGKIEVSVK